MGVSENSGTPKSSILIGFSIINHPFWGTPIFGNTQMAGSDSLYNYTPWRLVVGRRSFPFRIFQGYVSFRECRIVQNYWNLWNYWNLLGLPFLKLTYIASENLMVGRQAIRFGFRPIFSCFSFREGIAFPIRGACNCISLHLSLSLYDM